MSVKVAKFGGSSLADAGQFRKVAAIIGADAARCFVVPSAPGKRHKDDQKITDLLYLCHAAAQQRVGFDQTFNLIADRYLQIVADLKLSLNLKSHLAKIRHDIAAGASADYTASRGEYLNGLILADLLGYDFVDPAECIHFNDAGRFDAERTQIAMTARLHQHPRAVVPGFYGSTPDGQIKTFSRGGSDITGSIVARGAAASVYENWTDVSGLLMADPRVVEHPKTIDVVTYSELRELAYMGATVLHDEAIFPVRQAGIPVNIRNTNAPDHPGTLIVRDADPISHQHTITGIAGRKDFTVIALDKSLMNAEIGFARRFLSVLEDHGVSFEHMPSGIDTLSVVIADNQIRGKLESMLEQIRADCKPDAMDVYGDMALIATVGRGMAYTPGMAAKLFGALAAAGVNIRMIDQGSSELNIIVGVQSADFEKAVNAIYHAFVP
ncbi:MAG: aspartate kinase [Phycisphaeraceae bacterium]